MKKILFALFALILMSGCAAVKPPALTKTTNQLDLSNESIAFFSMKIGNKYVPGYQPSMDYMYFEEINPTAGKIHKYAVNLFKAEDRTFNEYLVSMQLTPGKYRFVSVPATSGVFPIRGSFTIPFDYEFTINANEIVYLGNVEAFLEKRTNSDDAVAGPTLPLIDQSVVGASGGTFKMAINDNFLETVKIFRSEYPVLNKYSIKKAIIKPL